MKAPFTFAAGVMMLALCAFNPIQASGQSDLELATYYYNSGAFEQAKLYLDNLYKKDPSTYDMFLNTLLELEDFDAAEKLVKARLKKRRDKTMAQVDLGSLYLRIGREEEAREAFQNALAALATGRGPAKRLADAFVKLDQLDLALATYEKAMTIGSDGYGYHYELANLKGLRGDYEGMVDSFMALLHGRANYLRTVQNSFNRNLRVSTDARQADMVRRKVLKASQLYPEDTVFLELLVWVFNQQRDFMSAMPHVRALDERKNEGGRRLMELAEVAAKNKDLETAYDCYALVSSKGPNAPRYAAARQAMLGVRTTQVTQAYPLDTAAAMDLSDQYRTALLDLGETPETAGLMSDWASLLAFHLNEASVAENILDRAVNMPGLGQEQRSEFKLDLGDILVFQDDVWSASLLFSQVDLDHKEGLLGQQAKFRNARVSYYTGDFNWAQAQLDILKASTSKLISNDAIDLSLLITDNFNLDTLTAPMEMFARADLLRYRNQRTAALATLDSLVFTFPGHTLEDEILLIRAEIAIERGEFTNALVHFEEILDLYAMDILADDALFGMASLHDNQLNDSQTAQSLYEQLLTEFPGSLYVVEARKRFRTLRGDVLE
jgi:tetratricopeptide (TPR) repeat protein